MHKPKKNKWPMPESQFQIVLGNVQHWKRHGLGESETLICCLFPENEIQLNEKIKSKIEHKKIEEKKKGSENWWHQQAQLSSHSLMVYIDLVITAPKHEKKRKIKLSNEKTRENLGFRV